MGFPAGWLIAAILTVGYYKKVGIEKNHLLDEKSA